MCQVWVFSLTQFFSLYYSLKLNLSYVCRIWQLYHVYQLRCPSASKLGITNAYKDLPITFQN